MFAPPGQRGRRQCGLPLQRFPPSLPLNLEPNPYSLPPAPSYNLPVFTGLIRHRGVLKVRSSGSLTIACPSLRSELGLGDSVAVSGPCLTVAKITADGFVADILPETLSATTLGDLAIGAQLNLELALAAGERFGGHFVQGHIDGKAKCVALNNTGGGNWRIEFTTPDWLAKWLTDKGSIALDGVSLTIQEIKESRFSVAVIPATYSETSLGNIKPGQQVNIEADMIVKAVTRAVEALALGGDLTEDGLRKLGYGG